MSSVKEEIANLLKFVKRLEILAEGPKQEAYVTKVVKDLKYLIKEYSELEGMFVEQYNVIETIEGLVNEANTGTFDPEEEGEFNRGYYSALGKISDILETA